MTFNKEEIKNIVNMLLSDDTENGIIAFSCIDNHASKKHLGELLVLYQFGRTAAEEWEKECKKGFKIIKNALQLDSKDYRVPSSTVFSALTANKCSEESIELYLELFTNQLSNNLYNMGYPTDKLEINVKIKDNE
jgi:hypothetical protein